MYGDASWPLERLLCQLRSAIYATPEGQPGRGQGVAV
jgi:hypothetical protein